MSFVAADLSFIFLGVGVIVAAVLITSTVLRVGGRYDKCLEQSSLSWTERRTDATYWKLLLRHLAGEHYGRELTGRHRLTTALRIVLGVTGLSLLGVGSIPEDYVGWAHNVSTAGFLVFSIATVVLLALLWREPRPKIAAFLRVVAIFMVVGGLVFLYAFIGSLAGWDISWVPAGLFERFVVYGFIAGMVTMGFTLSSGAHRRVRAWQTVTPRGAPSTTAPLGNSTTPGVPSSPVSSGHPSEPQ